jgi:hypothetical protein
MSAADPLAAAVALQKVRERETVTEGTGPGQTSADVEMVIDGDKRRKHAAMRTVTRPKRIWGIKVGNIDTRGKERVRRN